MTAAPASQRLPRLTRWLHRRIDGWNRLGEQTAFFVKSVRYIGEAVVHHKVETMRVIAQMSLGVGQLAMIGGSLAIVAFMMANTGSLATSTGYNQLSKLGLESLTGFFSVYANTRIAGPLITCVGLAATIGAGTTAQLGAMRINEEIDALEAMGIRSIAYLVSTRVVAGMVLVIPLFCVASEAGYLAARLLALSVFDIPAGTYDHYFSSYLKSTDLLWSLLEATATGVVVMLVHTYYGFNAFGGPAGVGLATGRAVRASLIVSEFATLAVALAVYGASGDFHLTG